MVSTMVIGPGMVILIFFFVCARSDQRFGLVHAALQPQRADDHRHHRVVAVVADAHLHLVLEVDALDVLEEAVHEVLPRLLAVGDDVDAGVLLLLQPEQRRVALRLRELVAARRATRARACWSRRASAGLGRLPAMVVSSICAPVGS